MVAGHNNFASLGKFLSAAPNFLADKVEKWNNNLGANFESEISPKRFSSWSSV
jgi:hypothetical protein